MNVARPRFGRRAAFALLGALLGGVALAGTSRAQTAPEPLAAPPLGPVPKELLTELEANPVRVQEQAGDPRPDDRAAQAQALVLFEQPRIVVLRLLAAVARQVEYRPELQRLSILEASALGDLVDYRVRFMLTTLHYRARHGWDFERGRVWWTLDPHFPNDLKVLDGLWEVRDLDERRTFGRFTTRIDLGPALPAFLQDYATRKKLPDSMEQVRRWVDSNGRWRP